MALLAQACQKPRATGGAGKTTKGLLGLCFALFFKCGGGLLFCFVFSFPFLQNASETPLARCLFAAEMEAGERLPVCLLQRDLPSLLRTERRGKRPLAAAKISLCGSGSKMGSHRQRLRAAPAHAQRLSALGADRQVEQQRVPGQERENGQDGVRVPYCRVQS